MPLQQHENITKYLQAENYIASLISISFSPWGLKIGYQKMNTKQVSLIKNLV